MKKPSITVEEFRLGRPRPEPEPSGDDYGEEDTSGSTANEAMRAACRDVMRAIKRDDEDELRSALDAFFEAKASEEKRETPEEESAEGK